MKTGFNQLAEKKVHTHITYGISIKAGAGRYSVHRGVTGDHDSGDAGHKENSFCLSGDSNGHNSEQGGMGQA